MNFVAHIGLQFCVWNFAEVYIVAYSAGISYFYYNYF